MAKLPPSRAKRSKVEVQKLFSGIADDVAQQKEAASSKTDELNKFRESEIRQSVDGITVDEVAQRITGLGLDVSKALAQLSERLVAEVDRLNSLREAVSLEAKELERLHKIDIAAAALDQMVQEYQRQKEELENEIFRQRTAWSEEERERERQLKESEENLKKQRQRELEEFEYKKSLERKKAQDKYEEELRKQEKENLEKQENLEKSWKLRESALKEKEVEWARLLKEVENFPGRLKNEVEAAVAAAVSAAKQGFEQQLLLLKKDSAADKRIAELQVSSLQETLSRQSAEIEALHKQLDEAKRQVQDIAVKAIEGASGAKALTDVKQVLMEQAKNRSQQG